MSQDFYEILGVNKSATEEEIKKAYKKAALKCHPDKGPEEERPQRTIKFQQLNEAYNTLSDPDKKRVYDLGGMDALKGGFPTPNGFNPADMQDLFNAFFNRGNGSSFFYTGTQRGSNKPVKNKETVYPLKVSLRDVVRGLTKKLKVTRKVIVDKITKKKIPVEDYHKTWNRCPGCSRVNSEWGCSSCTKGFILLKEYSLEEVSETVVVKANKGFTDGTSINFPDMGNASPGHLPGDLVVVIKCKNEEDGFVRSDNDLLYTSEIDLTDALCGVDFVLDTLDDKSVRIKLNGPIETGTKHTTKGRGINGGDLIVTFKVKFPYLTDYQKSKIKEILGVAPKM